MPGTKCAFNPATALRRVFVPSSLGTTDRLHVTRILVPALLAPSAQQTRTYWDRPRGSAGTWGSSTTSSSPYRNSVAAALAAKPAQPPRQKKLSDEDRPGPRVKTKLGRMPRDDEVRHPYVFVKEVWDDGVERLSEPRQVRELLATLDRKTQSLQVTYFPDAEDPNALQWPIAKIVNKKEELQRLQLEKEQRKKQAASNKEKELEINWSSTPHDLEHKVKNMQRFLAKGWKVQVLLLKKRGAKAQTKEKDAIALVDRILEAVTEVKGSKEWKGREGKLLGSMKLFLQGKPQDKTNAAVDGHEADS